MFYSSLWSQDVNKSNDGGETPIMVAVARQNLSACQILMEHQSRMSDDTDIDDEKISSLLVRELGILTTCM